MLYDKMVEPPAPGTPLESLMLLVWRMRQDIELQKVRAVVSAVIASNSEAEGAAKDMKDAWDDLLDEMYPHQRGQRVKSDQAALDFLKKEAERGWLKVTPLQPVGKVQSKLKTRYIEREDMKRS